MIKFTRIYWKNFLSTGNAGSELELDKYQSTLIVGKNGNGKSTIIDAICFALFGKPFRNINKPQLVNSINQKNCVVECEFEIGNKKYKVVRGIKPTKFEIYCDGKLLNKESALKDYQKILEQQILKLNYKTFTQVVILGSAAFTPFMQLSSSQRREVIEDILDIRIFSIMNSILKDKILESKDTINYLESDLKVIKTSVSSQQRLIQTISDAKTESINSIREKIKQNNEDLNSVNSEIEEVIREIDSLKSSLPDKKELDSNLKEVNRMISKFKTKIESSLNHRNFFIENDTCPSCEQNIEHSHKDVIISNIDKNLESYNEKLSKLDSFLSVSNRKLSIYDEVYGLISDSNIKLSNLNNTARYINNQITELNNDIEKIQSDTSDINLEKTKLKDLSNKALDLINRKTQLLEERNLQEISSTLLKDNGIKTAIIREYLPIINSLINKYLACMDVFIKFELDESFNEVIKSRYRDTFSYSSFSEGEKLKIDIAILFAWRQIAKMKNSVNTNLLIMDEIYDSSLDASSVESLTSILGDMADNTNIFIISHRSDSMYDKFDRVIEAVKVNDFSTLKTI